MHFLTLFIRFAYLDWKILKLKPACGFPFVPLLPWSPDFSLLVLNVLLISSTHQQRRLRAKYSQLPLVWVHQALPSAGAVELVALSFLGTAARLPHRGLEVLALHWAWLKNDRIFFVLSCTTQSQKHMQDLTQSLLENLTVLSRFF